MEPSTRDNNAPPTTASDLPRSPLRDQTAGSYVIVLTEERFFEELQDMFEHAEHPHRRSWEAHLYRPWGYVFTSWGLTFSRPRTSLTCGAQWPFLFRMDGPKEKVMGYVYPDLVLIHSDSENKVSTVFLVVEIKALPDVDWNTIAGKARASTLLTKATKQAQTQAKLAFLQHKDQSSIQAFLACGVWWLAVRYSRSEILNAPAEPQRTSRRSGPSRDQGTKRSRRSRRKHKANKKTKGMDFPRRVYLCTHYRIIDTHRPNEGGPNTPPRWLPEQEPDPQNASASDEEDDDDDDDPVARDDLPHGKGEGHSVPPSLEYGVKRPVYHVMQLGASKKALNPWFKALLASVIDKWPGMSTSDFQRTWFDQTDDERKLDYRWEFAGRADDEGFAAGFQLPEGKEITVTIDDPSNGVDFLLQVDGSAHPIALNMDGDTDLSSLTSPHLRLPDQFDFLSEEVLDELATALMDRMTMKQTQGFQPSDFATPRSSTNRTDSQSSTVVPARPTQHIIHAADRKILPLPSSSAFNSDVSFPSSPSPHDRQRDNDGFVIPSLPPHHRNTSAQDHSLNKPMANLEPSRSVIASAQGSRTPQASLHHTQPSTAAFHRALRGSGSTTPRAHAAPAPRPSTDASAGRGREGRAGAHLSLDRPRKYHDGFAAASDIPARRQTPRVRAHSVAGVTHTHAHDSAYDSDSEWTIPQASSPGRDYPTHYGAGPREPSGARVVQYPKSKRGEFSSRSTSQVVEVTMHLGPTKSRRKREQEREAGGSGSGDARQPGRDNSGAHDGEPRGKEKGRTG